MGTSTVLTMGVDAFTRIDLLNKAATHKGLKLHDGAWKAYSEPIKVYTLDDKLLAALAERGIKQQARPDCLHEIFTLVDENPQERSPGWAPSNYWNFMPLKDDKRKFDLRVTLNVFFGISTASRGIIFMPQASGTFVSPADQLPNFRMFKTLVENDDNIPTVAKELAASDGNIVITWTELGLGGLRKLSDLFSEFAAGNEAIARLGRSGETFDPIPYPRYQQPGDELFIPKPAQPQIIQKWRVQLNEYRAKLIA